MSDNITGVSAAAGNGTVFTVTKITSVVGDCDVTQRKGKTLCIYDMKLVFSVKVSSDEDSESSRQVLVTVPEFIHDQAETDYVFKIDADDRRDELRTHLVPLVVQKLAKFQSDLIQAHDHDVKHNSS